MRARPLLPWSSRLRDERGASGLAAIVETVLTVAVAVLLAWLIQAYLVKPYKIPSGSMENTLRCRDRVLVNRVSYHLHDPKRGDVVVFHPPADHDDAASVYRTNESEEWSSEDGASKDVADDTFIKRLIGLPGDTVEVKDRHAYVDGKELDEPYLHPDEYTDAAEADERAARGADFGPVQLGDGQYLMLGDNRLNSRDGRWFGPIRQTNMIGKAFFVYWPLGHLGGIPKHADGPRSSSSDLACDENQVGP